MSISIEQVKEELERSGIGPATLFYFSQATGLSVEEVADKLAKLSSTERLQALTLASEGRNPFAELSRARQQTTNRTNHQLRREEHRILSSIHTELVSIRKTLEAIWDELRRR